MAKAIARHALICYHYFDLEETPKKIAEFFNCSTSLVHKAKNKYLNNDWFLMAKYREIKEKIERPIRQREAAKALISRRKVSHDTKIYNMYTFSPRYIPLIYKYIVTIVTGYCKSSLYNITNIPPPGTEHEAFDLLPKERNLYEFIVFSKEKRSGSRLECM